MTDFYKLTQCIVCGFYYDNKKKYCPECNEKPYKEYPITKFEPVLQKYIEDKKIKQIGSLIDEKGFGNKEPCAALTLIGEKAIPILLKKLKKLTFNEEPIFKALGELGYSSASKLLIKKYNHTYDLKKEEILYNLGYMKDDKSISFLKEILNKSESKEERMAAAFSLSKINLPKTIEILIERRKIESNFYINKLIDVVIENNPQYNYSEDAKNIIRLNDLKEKLISRSISSEELEELEQMRWKPQSDEEKLRYFYAKREWQQLLGLGPLGKAEIVAGLAEYGSYEKFNFVDDILKKISNYNNKEALWGVLWEALELCIRHSRNSSHDYVYVFFSHLIKYREDLVIDLIKQTLNLKEELIDVHPNENKIAVLKILKEINLPYEIKLKILRYALKKRYQHRDVNLNIIFALVSMSTKESYYLLFEIVTSHLPSEVKRRACEELLTIYHSFDGDLMAEEEHLGSVFRKYREDHGIIEKNVFLYLVHMRELVQFPR